jgi:hypothetical protein
MITAKPSLRYELICDGAVRKYPNGREMCCDSPKGNREYKRRIEEMRLRQHNVCSLGNHLIVNPTFGHSEPRGMGGAWRDDRIVDKDGKPMNSCQCLTCNVNLGSRRMK